MQREVAGGAGKILGRGGGVFIAEGGGCGVDEKRGRVLDLL